MRITSSRFVIKYLAVADPDIASDGGRRRDQEARSDSTDLMVPINGITHRAAGGRLIVMSNRAPIRIVRVGGREQVEPTVGGVGTTFLRLLERSGGRWVAWAGGRKTPEAHLLPPTKPPVQNVFART